MGRGWLERGFEWMLWRCRFLALIAVLASVVSACAIFFMITVDVLDTVTHLRAYVDGSLEEPARALLRRDTIAHLVAAVDGYLLATVLLIFALGMYELFVSELEVARASPFAQRVLVIESLDDLKNRLAKVILIILVVAFFEKAFKMPIDTPQDLLYLSASIALVGLALYLTHASEGPAAPAGHPPGAGH